MSDNEARTPETQRPALVIGIGAGAGGVGAVESFLRNLPGTDNLAIVVVARFESDETRRFSERLRAATTLPFVPIRGSVALEANRVYVVPESASVCVNDGVVRTENGRSATPVDRLFHSLSEAFAERAVGIVFSGAGSDGTLGLKAISDRGGMTMAQSPETADYEAMPRNAAIVGVADHVLSPEAMPAELLAYANNLRALTVPEANGGCRASIEQSIPAVAGILRREKGHDFQHYKPTTLVRRIQRRLQVLRFHSIDAYLAHLRTHPEEVEALFRDLLISVTAFFRDPKAFEALAREAIPALFDNRARDEPIRIWVAGCASGEEAYSIAMLVREESARRRSTPEVQIFATDIDDHALRVAREGLYPTGIASDISSERLERFFLKRGQRFQVAREIRELCLFSHHNLISDPPLTHLDLITCRNLLIYLGPHLQKKLVPMFHYALRPGGYLFLGPSETISAHQELFRIVDGKHRIAERRAVSRAATILDKTEPAQKPWRAHRNLKSNESNLAEVMQRVVLDEFAPKAVVVDDKQRILCASGDMSKYLKVGAGLFQNQILKLVRAGLRVGLRAAMGEALENKRRVVHDNLSVRVEGKLQPVAITVQPMPQLGAESDLLLIAFEDVGEAVGWQAGDVTGDTAMIEQLEAELQGTREDLETSVQELEAANEELKSSNEELRSTNEELHSANEELESRKDEIQAANEALEGAHSDLQNLLLSTEIAVIFLDDDFQIRSFTPAVSEIYNLIESDVGRPLWHQTHRALNMPPLPAVSELSDSEPIEHIVQTTEGRWFVRRVRPYNTHQGRRAGMVITFTDMTKLAESEERFRALVDATSQIVWTTDAAGSVVEDSPSWRAFTGQSYQEWKGWGFLDALHPRDRDRVETLWKSAVETGSPLATDYRIRRVDGEWRWTSVRAVPVMNVDGTIREWVGMNTDITDRKTSERERRASERRLQVLADNVPDIVFRADERLGWTYVNSRFSERTGATESEALGDGWMAHLHPDDRGRTERALECSRSSGDELQVEHRLRQRDGSFRWFVTRAVPPGSRDESDNAPSEELSKEWFGTSTEVHQLKETQHALRRAEEQRRLALVAGRLGVYEVDLETETITLDERAREILALHRESIHLDKALSRVHPQDRGAVDELLDNAREGVENERSWVEFRANVPGRDEIWIAANAHVQLEENARRHPRLVGTLQEITERKHAEQELRTAQIAAESASRAKSQFLANMSHEIRTPLTAILGYADVLAKHLIDDPEALEYADTIRRNGSYLLEILNDVLDLSKIEAGQLEIRTERFRPDAVVAEVRSLMEVQAVEKGISLVIDFDGELPETIESDASRLRQILLNLVANAIKFTERGSVRLVARLRREMEKLQFEVIDTGVGIAPEKQKTLFQPFTQADASPSRRFMGSGLGLTISQRLAHLLGGEIKVDSEPGRGSTFEVTIGTGPLKGVPLVVPSSEIVTARNARAQRTLPQIDGAILVVDDRREVRALAKYFLEEAGARVDTANDGREAIDEVRRTESGGEPYDIVLMDMQMPGMDGYEAVSRLRAGGYSSPIIALTAHAMQGEREKCLAAGCDDYASKPIDGDELVALIARHSTRRAPDHRLSDRGESAADGSARAQGHRILLVDDSQDLLESKRILLEARGHEVRIAASGAAALDVAEGFEADVVILDLGLPDLSGHELLPKLKQVPSLDDAVFLALSGRDEEDDRRRSLEAGFVDHLVKPVPVDELERIVDEALGDD